jgi:hypothetical protein
MAYMEVIRIHSLHKWDLWHYLTYFLGLLKSGIFLETKSLPNFTSWHLEFLEVFLKQKHSSLYTPQMALLNRSVVYE